MGKDHPTGKSGLYQAILKLETPEQCYRFFQDVCSYSELSAMEQRYDIAEMLAARRIYTDIKEKTGASSAIISRVNRVLSAEGSNPTAITTCNTAGETHEALAAPQTVAAGKPFIEVKLGEGTFYFRPQDDVVLEAGYRYTYTVNVNATGLTLASCEIGGWEPGQGESGVAEIVDYFYDESSNTFIVYTDKGLLAWNEAAQSDLTLNCTLVDDIDLTAIDWTPVGNYNTPYTGTFDGGGHTITGLTVDLPDQNYVGLIGCIGEEGTVMNLTLTDIQIEIESNNRSVYAGGVAGYNAGTVTDCHTTGSVSGTGGSDCSVCAGGVVGLNYGTVTGCYATGIVNASSSSFGSVYVGGVVGCNDYDGTVTGCYWSDYDGNGIGDGSGSGETTKVNGTDVTWENAQSGMNIAIDAWNNSNPNKPCNWHYEGATATTPPTLVESSNP